MKKCLYCIGLFTFFVFISVIFTNAQQNIEYLITQNGEEYSLYKTDGVTSEYLSSSSDLESLIKSTSQSAVTLKDVNAYHSVTLSDGEYLIRGNAVLYDCFCVEGNAKVTLDSFSASFEGARAYVRIKGGELAALNANISSENSSCVVLDYSAKSRFSMYDGELYSKKSAALSVQNGVAEVHGGKIKSEAEYAIENKATLILTGTPSIDADKYGILTDTPISLSSNDRNFRASISVKFLSEFKKGSKTETFRACTQESIKNITFFDKNGNEAPLTYFELDEHNGETNFAAVYRPYTVRMFDGGDMIGTREFLYTDELFSISAPQKNGYIFDKWFVDEGLSEQFIPSQNSLGDFDIYASYKLKAPEFSISSLNFVYSGNSRLLAFNSLTHELSDGGRFELEWFKNGDTLGIFDGGVNIKNVSDSGEYSCKITFYYGNDKVTVTTPTVPVSVSKSVVALPKSEAVSYNGKMQYSSLRDNALYTVDDTGAQNAGVYSVTLTLRYPENYVFANGEGFACVDFEIIKAQNGWTSLLSAFDIYENQAPHCSAYARFGEVYYLFSDRPDGDYSENIPKNHGRFYVIAVVDETENYSGMVSAAAEFRVKEERAIGITAVSVPPITEYKAFDTFNTVGTIIEVLYNSGRREQVGAEFLSVSYQSANDIRYGDNGVVISYLGCETMIPITVKKRKYDVSNILFENKSVEYDGSSHTIAYEGELPVGLDGIPLSASVALCASDAGRYNVRLVFDSESKNYELPAAKEAILEIKPYVCDVRWGECEFVYDGEAKLPSAEFTDVYGKIVSLTPSGAIINATDRAYATVLPPSSNYLFNNPTVPFSVKKATYDFSGVFWEADSYVYNGREHINRIFGLPEGVYAVGYTDNRGTNAGKYKTSVLLDYDENNYNAPPILVHEWEITVAEYDTDGLVFEDVIAVYDGAMHYPLFKGEMPIGLDGISLKYEFSEGALRVGQGKVEVIITFYTESENYAVPPPTVAFVEILPMPIEVVWEYSAAYYDGLPHLPVAKSELCEISVSGEGIGAGDYVARASAVSDDFTVINPTFSFSVLPAENYFTEEPKIENMFFGETPSPRAKAFCGEVMFNYYTDEDCTKAASLPLTVGDYYMQAVVSGVDNYAPLVSQAVKFSVFPVLICGIEVNVINEAPRAFSKLCEKDIEVLALYTNGEKLPVLFENVSLSYQNADSIRANDEYVTVIYEEFSVKAPISAKKAVMEKSDFLWDCNNATYNGQALHPRLIKLPYGVTVSEYRGAGVNAGVYTVSAILDYDTENYESAPTIECLFTVNRRIVPIPTLPHAIYNAQPHVPVSDSQLYGFSADSYVGAGEYYITAVLTDSQNFVFENGEDRAELPFIIKKMPLRASINPMVLYRDTEEYMPEYELYENAIEGDELGLFYEISDGFVYLRCQNPNYEIIAERAELIVKKTLSPNARANVLTLAVMIIILIAISLIVFFRRDRILDKLAAYRCKRRFASESVNSSHTSEPCFDIGEISANAEKIIAEDFENDEPSDNPMMSVDMERADQLITDSLAKNLLRNEGEQVITCGRKKQIVNVDTLSENFCEGERVDVNSLKEHNLVAKDTGYIKILARGAIDKPLSVYANAFSLSAVKMIALTGGVAVKVSTTRKDTEKIEGFKKEHLKK